MRVEELLRFLTDSLMLEAPLIKNDPAFTSLVENLYPALKVIAYTNDIDINHMSSADVRKLIVLMKIEIYTRLSLSSAKEYDFNVEYAGFKKSDRFEHYNKLVERARQEYQDLEATFHEIYVKNVLISSRDGTQRNYMLGAKAVVEVEAIRSGKDILVDWSVTGGSSGLVCFVLYFSSKPFYDRYEGVDMENVESRFTLYKPVSCYKLKSAEDVKYVGVEVKYSNGTSYIGYTEIEGDIDGYC